MTPWKEAVKPMVEKHSKDYQDIMDAIEAARP
jgi:hypothetical protein